MRTQGIMLTFGILFASAAATWSFAPTATYPAPTALAAGQQAIQEYKMGANTWVYLAYLPPTYDSQPNKKWPTIFYFEVQGGNYDGMWGWDGFTKNGYGPAKYLLDPSTCVPKVLADSFVVITPWLYGGLDACNASDTALYKLFFPSLISRLFSTIRIDSARINIDGYCFGGTVGYMLSSLYPALPASLMMWSPGLNGWMDCVDVARAPILKDIAIQIFSGTADLGTPPANGQAIAAALTNAGNPHVTMNVLQGAPHETWSYGIDNDPALYNWMLTQRRQAGATALRSASSASSHSERTIIPGAMSFGNFCATDKVEAINLCGEILAQGTAAEVRLAIRQSGKGLTIVRLAGIK
jgi:predicted peptidase